MTNEVRTTDEETGAQKGVKLERFDLIPVGPLTDLARHYGMGAAKYEDRNWEKGYDWSKSYGAAQRHLTQFWGGEDLDPDPFYDQFPPECRPKHVTAAAWHCFGLSQFMDLNRHKDNRPVLWLPGRPAADAETPPEYTQLVEFAAWATSTEYDSAIKTPQELVDRFLARAQ